MNQLAKPVQYLLRVDDLCPAMAAEPWQRIAALIEEFRLRPILAVVPENRDPELARMPANFGFWDEMRRFEAAGAAIGLHGYRHLCRSKERGLLRLANGSEFAGVHEEIQREWIRKGLRILRGFGLNPKVWVAPRHGFDQATLRVLRAEGIGALSDGLARAPFLRGGLAWIPQQLWAPEAKRAGLWTICIHPNTMGGAEMEALQAFLREHAGRFTSVDRVLAKFGGERLSLREALYAKVALGRIRARRWRHRL